MRLSSLFLGSALAGLAFAACATSSDDSLSSTDRDHAAPRDKASIAAPDLCASLADELTGLLAAAQRCHVAAANPIQCASWVPSIDGCAQPVAYPGSDEAKAYLAAFEAYAAHCPLPDPPCADPSTLAVDCMQSPDVDGAFGRCAILEP